MNTPLKAWGLNAIIEADRSDSQEMSPMSSLVMALPKAKVEAVIINAPMTPFDMPSVKLRMGFRQRWYGLSLHRSMAESCAKAVNGFSKSRIKKLINQVRPNDDHCAKIMRNNSSFCQAGVLSEWWVVFVKEMVSV